MIVGLNLSCKDIKNKEDKFHIASITNCEGLKLENIVNIN